MNRKYKSIEELTIRDNFMFVKVFSDEEIARPFLKALLKIDIEKVFVVGEAFQQRELKKQYIVFLCPKDIFGNDRPIYEFENREKSDHSLTLGDLTYKIFCNFSKYDAVTDYAIRDYLKYFATGEVTSAATKAIDNKVDFYHKDPKTRSDYMTFEAMLEEERDEAREEGRNEGAQAKNKELAKAFRDDGFPLEAIAKRTGLSPEEIRAL